MLLTIAYFLDARDNDAYFLGEAPENFFCNRCGCCIDYEYHPQNFYTKRKYDLSYTYDRRLVASARFKDYLLTQDSTINFIPLNITNEFFLVSPANLINFSALQKEGYCFTCNQYYSQVAPVPDFYQDTRKNVAKGIYFTNVNFGSGKSLFPSIVLGVETAQKISSDIKNHKFRGIEINKIEVKVS